MNIRHVALKIIQFRLTVPFKVGDTKSFNKYSKVFRKNGGSQQTEVVILLVVGNKRTKNTKGFWLQKADVLDGGKTVYSVECRKIPRHQ